jgi:hypothetical protein
MRLAKHDEIVEAMARATRIADVKKKAEAATPGPWFVGAMNDGLFVIDQPPRPSNDDTLPTRKVKCLAKFEYAEKANADYTAAAAPDLFLAMAARIEELEKERDAAREHAQDRAADIVELGIRVGEGLARIEELEKALEPFAEAAKCTSPTAPQELVHVEDFRTAARAVSDPKPASP